jgi:medium-chain acyl-[acyl-carrier-protein] hydrolase
LPPDIEVCALQLPGWADRLDEQPFDRLTQLLETLTQVLFPYLDKPFAFYGHSMGGLIGFELAHHLHREHNKLPAHLFVGAVWAPQLPFPDSLSNFDFSELSQQNAEFRRLSLSSLKAQYLLFKNYSRSNEQPLNCPITVFGGMQDRVVTRDYLSSWRWQTNSTFKLQMLPGNHFFLLSDLDVLLPMISEDIKSYLKK